MAAGGKMPPEDGCGGRERHLPEFELYETRSNFYMIGMDEEGESKMVLKIGRSEPSELNLCEDDTVYSATECRELLKRIHEGNKSTGGLKFVTNCYGIIGFAKFLGPYYMLLVTKRRPVGEIYGHVIYTVTESRTVTISSSRVAPTASEVTHENRYKKLLCMVDLTKDFFFSYSFHVMLSLQKNFSDSQKGESAYETMFVWNEFLTREIRNHLKNSLWTVALVYGFFKQTNLKLRESGKEFKLTLIARRSRHYAGTRFMKRGVNEKGSVANDVETEQIVFEDVPGAHLSQISSVVQYRGSIPLFWSQETSKLNLKPDIVLQEKDPKFEATKLHFENLVERYGNSIIILNLIKTHERKPRESKLWAEFANAIESINRHLSEEDYLRFLHWDLSRYSKMDATAALAFLEKVAGSALKSTGLFHCQLAQHGNNGPSGCILKKIQNVDNQGASNDSTRDNLVRPPILQRGVLRTNCIDCLDRTNVAQYAYGLAALGCQLHVLGLIENSKIDPDDPLTNELMNSYETMGDTLALQYTGSAAHNKIFSERRGHWKAAIQSQEFFRTLQRYYSNAYMDAEKQAAINVFLGQCQPNNEGEPCQELGSDQHFKPVRRANGVTDEISRSIVKRSHSDGNVSCEYKVSRTNLQQQRTSSPVLNSVTHGGSHNGLRSSQSEVYSSDGSIFFSSKLSVDSDRICSDSGRITNHVYEQTSSNFLDLSWLSSSESSWDEENFKSSLSSGSPVQEPSANLLNGSDGEIVPEISDGLSLQKKKSANIESSDDVGNMSEHFVHWVISGGTFHY